MDRKQNVKWSHPENEYIIKYISLGDLVRGNIGSALQNLGLHHCDFTFYGPIVQ